MDTGSSEAAGGSPAPVPVVSPSPSPSRAEQAIGSGSSNSIPNSEPSSGSGLLGTAVDWAYNTIVRPINDYIVQPIYNNVVAPIGNAAVGFASDMVPMVNHLVTTPINTVLDFGAGIIKTGSHLLNGDFSEALGSFGNTVVDLALAPIEYAVGTLAIGLHATAGVIDNLFQLGDSVSLSGDQITYLQHGFPNLDLSQINLQSGGVKGWLANLVGLPLRPHAVGNDIFLTNNLFGNDGTLVPSALVTLGHEVGHVNQYQTGGADYIGEALVALGLEYLGLGPGYDSADDIAADVPFEELNKEQQAVIMGALNAAIKDHPNGHLNYNNFVHYHQDTDLGTITKSEFVTYIKPLAEDRIPGVVVEVPGRTDYPNDR